MPFWKRKHKPTQVEKKIEQIKKESDKVIIKTKKEKERGDKLFKENGFTILIAASAGHKQK